MLSSDDALRRKAASPVADNLDAGIPWSAVAEYPSIVLAASLTSTTSPTVESTTMMPSGTIRRRRASRARSSCSARRPDTSRTVARTSIPPSTGSGARATSTGRMLPSARHSATSTLSTMGRERGALREALSQPAVPRASVRGVPARPRTG